MAASKKARPRLIVADDVADNRELYAIYFSHAGYHVDQAADGEQALALVAEKRPDAIVMDVSMPKLDGLEATRRIKSNTTTKDIVVLVVTGHATKEDIDRARAVGADDVCTKPCLPEHLLARMKSLLVRR